jgi:adenine-specific DNA-methyltransferase
MKENFENNYSIDKDFYFSKKSSDKIEDFNLYLGHSNIDEYIYQKMGTFPKTRYYGSKKRILKWIYDNVKDLSFNTVLDGFGGTASVSLLFKAMNKEVTYNDILKSNTISAKTLLQNKLPVKILEAGNFIDSIEPIKNGFISQNFQNIFYTDEENEWLDGAMYNINNFKSAKKRRLYLYCLFQASLMKRPFNLFHRANLNLRINVDVERSFGNLTTWNTPFQDLMKTILFELNSLVWDNGKKIKVLKSQNIENINKKFDLVYLDPPYVNNSNNSDNYLKRYHFLEGLSDYENWSKYINNDFKIKYCQSNSVNAKWEDKNIFKDNLFGLIKKHKDSIVVLSYMSNAIPSVSELSDFFEENFSKVTISTYHLSHALAKNKRTEILIIGEP